MDSQIERRLNSFLSQLQTEYGIFNRMVYKNKNQHRRCSYFQYLLKVRSDLRLLQLTRLDEIVNSSFLVINGERAKQKVQLLESLKRRKRDGGKHNFLERLQGAAHLLAEMVEPMLKAAIEISTLLARSFFVGFCMTILALLARLRVLVQQILLDVVSLYNMVSSLSQKQQSVKLGQVGFEVFREYYPTYVQVNFLECVWETDKYRLFERISEPDNKNQEMHKGEETSQQSSLIQYNTIETFLGDDESEKVVPSQTSEENLDNTEKNTKPMEGRKDDYMLVEDGMEVKDNSVATEPCAKDLPSDGSLLTSSSTLSNPPKLASATRSQVAFIQIKRPAAAPSTVNEVGLELKQTESTNGGEKEDTFFSLLTAGIPKGEQGHQIYILSNE